MTGLVWQSRAPGLCPAGKAKLAGLPASVSQSIANVKKKRVGQHRQAAKATSRA